MLAWFCVFVCAWAAGRELLGQPRKVPVNGAQVMSAARFAVAEFNKANEVERFAYKVMNITSAKIQLVSGVNYILEAQLGRTVCIRRSTGDSEPCALHPQPKECLCHFVIRDIPWEHSRVLAQNKCHPNKN